MGKASIEEQTETYADGKQKGLFAAINATTTYGNYLELLPYTLCIMTLYTLGLKQPSKADLDIIRSRPVRTSRCTELHKTQVCYEYGYAQADTIGRYRTFPTRR